jgi:hypothetical protein
MTKQEKHAALYQVLREAECMLSLSELMERLGDAAPPSSAAMRTLICRFRATLHGDVLVTNGRKYQLIKQGELAL